jgi:hypothetical protein
LIQSLGHQDRPTTKLNAMNYSASVVSSAFWLAEPIVEVGWEQPKTKPVQTEVERRLWEIRRQTANPKKGWIDALVYTAFAGSVSRRQRAGTPNAQNAKR